MPSSCGRGLNCITAVLAEAQAPMPFNDLRARCRVRTATLYERLAALATSDRVIKQGDCYRAGLG